MDEKPIPQTTEMTPPDAVLQPSPVGVPGPVGEVMSLANPWRELGEVLWLSLPIIITMLSYTLMNFADVMMVGRHSTEELAAVGPAASTFFLIASLMMGTLSITNTFVSQSVGRGEKREAPRYVWQAVYLAAMWGVVAISLSPLASSIFAWAGHADQVQVYETSYFKYMLFRVPALGFWMAVSSFYQATKRPVVPMVVGVVGNVFNLALNYALIFGKFGLPEMGITGAALATVIATYLQAGMMFWIFLGPRAQKEYGTRDAVGLSGARFWRVIRFGAPAGLSWSLENASWTLFLLKIVGALGPAALAANNATMQIIHVSFMPIIGLNVGVQAIVGHHVGAKDYSGAKRRAYRAMLVAIGYMSLMGAVFFLFRHSLIALFNGQDVAGEQAAEIVRLGGTMLIFAAIFQAFDAVAITSYGALKGAGDTLFPMIVTIVCCWCVFIPLAMFLVRGLHLGVAGAWLGVTVNVGLVSGIIFWRFASGAWRKIDVFKGAAA